jgi:hypothetical protein
MAIPPNAGLAAAGQAVAIGASILMPNFRVWNLRNLDTNETLQGQFEATAVSENIPVTWESHTALNRSRSIKQFVNRGDGTLSFGARFYQDSIVGDPFLGGGPILGNPPKLGTSKSLGKLATLKKWCEPDPALRRPPILEFWVGDGHIQMTCVITSLSDIVYGRPNYFGGFRDVTLTINLEEFTTFSLDDEGATDTRYARAKERDYYELLAFFEYGNPMLGDVIRKDHPKQQLLKEGDTVKLPSIEGVRDKEVTQQSIPLKGGFGRKATAQKALVQRVLDRHSQSYVSHVLQPSTSPVR